MSLIADALRKAETTSPASPPPPSPGSLWVYRALLLGCVAVVLAGLGVVAKRRARTASVPPSAAPAAAPVAKREPSGLQLLRTAQRDLRLNGIVRGGPGKALALINDQVVEEGDQIEGARLVRIDPDSVHLEENGRARTLILEE